MAETREYLNGDLHNGDRHSGEEIANHIQCEFIYQPQGWAKAHRFWLSGTTKRRGRKKTTRRRTRKHPMPRKLNNINCSIRPLTNGITKGVVPIRRPLRGWLRVPILL